MLANVMLSFLMGCALAQLDANGAPHTASDVCDVEADAAAVIMLQQHLSVQPGQKAVAKIMSQALQAPELPPEQRLQDALPLMYFHIPKTGTSILNAMLNLPGVCESQVVMEDATGYAPGEWLETLAQCPGFSNELESHRCLQHVMPGGGSHSMAMFRQPEQRLISYYNYIRREFSLTTAEYPVMDFFKRVRGGMVYQLTHSQASGPTDCSGMSPPAGDAVCGEDVAEAVRIVKEDLVFVGVTEQWDLSVCLLHVMFGGPCARHEFADVRPGIDPETGQVRVTGSEYDVSVLQGEVDAADRVLYDEVCLVFERNLEAFGVSAESCEQGCWAEAGIF